MNVVNPNNTEHEIVIIPRYNLGDGVGILNLFDEVKKTSTDLEFNFSDVDGYFSIFFTFDFNEGDRFQIKITENNRIAYRGKIFATSQNTQDYKTTTNAYYY